MNFSDIYFKEHERYISETALMNGKKYYSFISADYYSLNTHTFIKQAAMDAIQTYGTSLSVGQFSDRSPLIKQLEARLCTVASMEASCIFTSGYTANLGAISATSKIDNVFYLYDKLCHASIVSAIKSTKCGSEAFAHNDMTELTAKLNTHQGKTIIVITEGLYSADGDFVDLPSIVALKERYDFMLYVDEAHSFVISSNQKNVAQIFNEVAAGSIDIISGSLSKALCSTGGFVIASSKMIDRIRMSREYIFSTGITPSNIAASVACLELLSASDRHQKLAENIAYFRQKAKENNINLGMSNTLSPIFTIFPNEPCAELYQSLLDVGILVQPLLYPAVPKEHERLRVLINAAHETHQLDALIDSVVSKRHAHNNADALELNK